MKKIIRCCFAGHSDVRQKDIKCGIKSIVEFLITQYEASEFWVGNYGNFDFYCAGAVNELKKVYPHIKLYLVIPYLTKKITCHKELYYDKFDDIIIADIPLKTPKKFQIVKSNEYMVNNSDFLICFIEKSWGGAARTLQYAERKHLKIYNLAEIG